MTRLTLVINILNRSLTTLMDCYENSCLIKEFLVRLPYLKPPFTTNLLDSISPPFLAPTVTT